MSRYARPARLEDALQLLAQSTRQILAGGTDYFAAHVERRPSHDLLDITALQELRGIELCDGHWRIGAGTTWSELLAAPLPPLFDGLKQAAREIGGRQIQNTATLAGNLCNASPAADGVPALLTLRAEVELAHAQGLRRLPLAEFLLGSRRTALRQDEILTALHLPQPEAPARSAFAKLGARKYLVISIAMASVVLEHRDGKVSAARIAIGACSPVAQRLAALEAEILGAALDRTLAERVAPRHIAALAPIGDLRASAAYRHHAALTLLRRLLARLGEPA